MRTNGVVVNYALQGRGPLEVAVRPALNKCTCPLSRSKSDASLPTIAFCVTLTWTTIKRLRQRPAMPAASHSRSSRRHQRAPTSDIEEDGDVSAASVEDEAHSTPSPVLEKQQPKQNADQERHFKTTAETQAMLNGLKPLDGETVEEVNFDDSAPPENYPASSHAQRSSYPQRKPHFGSNDCVGLRDGCKLVCDISI